MEELETYSEEVCWARLQSEAKSSTKRGLFGEIRSAILGGSEAIFHQFGVDFAPKKHLGTEKTLPEEQAPQ